MNEQQSKRAFEIWEAFEGLSHAEREARLNRLVAEDPPVAAFVSQLLANESSAAGTVETESGPLPLELASRELLDDGFESASRLLEAVDVGGAVRERYAVLKLAGQGGMARVYKVRDLRLDRILAMKVLDLPRATQARASLAQRQLLVRFVREARLTGRLDHPGIVAAQDIGTTEQGEVFFTMRFIAGRTLRQLMEDEARTCRTSSGTPSPRIVRALHRVVETVAFAHEHGVVHRDLKPENVMVGRFGEVYVLDWGVALDAQAEGGDTNSAQAAHADSDSAQFTGRRGTLPGTVLGTPTYMAPEQRAGRAADARSDVYALGRMLVESFAGTRAPAELASIAAKCLNEDPRLRYPAALDLARDLEAFLEGRIVYAHRTGAWAEFSKWVSRNRLSAALAGIVLVTALAGLAGVALSQARGERRAKQEKDARWRVVETFTEVLQGLTPDANYGTEFTLGQFADQSREVIAARLGEPIDANSRGWLQFALGRVEQSLGDLERAGTSYSASLESFSETAPADPQSSFNVLMNQASVAQLKGQWERSAECLRRAESVLEASLTPDPIAAGRLLSARGMLLFLRGAYSESEQLLRQALAQFQDHPAGERKAIFVKQGIAQVMNEQGRFEEALGPAREAYEALEGAQAPPSERAHAAYTLGVASAGCGELERARQLAEMAQEMRLELYGEESSEVADTFFLLGRIASLTGELDAAETSLRRASSIHATVNGNEHPRTLCSLGQLGVVLGMIGRLGECEALAKAVLETSRMALGAAHPTTLQTAGLLLKALEEQGRLEEAKQHLTQTLEFVGDEPLRNSSLAQALRFHRIRLARQEDDLVSVLELMEEYVSMAAPEDARLGLVREAAASLEGKIASE